MTAKKLRIAIIADPELPVPPLLYGGIERIIAMLISGLVKAGHEVALFAHKDSKTEAKLFPYKGKTSHNYLDVLKNGYLINKELISNQYDIVHCFGRLIYLLPQLPLKTPKLMSYQREPTIKQIQKAVKFAKNNSLTFTGCSAYITKQISPFATAFPIFNGVDLTVYDFKNELSENAPLVFLGRLEPIKGAHLAIKVAQVTGKSLVIAGNVPDEHQNYFESEIKPHLSDQIRYVGAVNDAQKNQILGNALALLMPIQWDEPFGIVMAEAMACGTPVIAFNRGAVPEIILDGENGFRCNNVEEMIDSVENLNKIDRKTVIADAVKRFSSEVIVKEYLELYDKMISRD